MFSSKSVKFFHLDASSSCVVMSVKFEFFVKLGASKSHYVSPFHVFIMSFIELADDATVVAKVMLALLLY